MRKAAGLPPAAAPAPAGGHAGRGAPLAARGEPFVWLSSGGLALALLMIAGLLLLILWNGMGTFWPRPIVELTLADGSRVLGEAVRRERYRPGPEELESLPEQARRRVQARGGESTRTLVRTGNFDLEGEDFRWVPRHLVERERWPADAWLVERREWGPAIGRVEALLGEGAESAAGSAAVAAALPGRLAEARRLRAGIRRLERDDIGAINRELERLRLEARREALRSGEGSPAHEAALGRSARREAELRASYGRLEERILALRDEQGRHRLRMRTARGAVVPESPRSPEVPLTVAQVVRAYPANALSGSRRLAIYLSRWWEFLASEPREANTEGGVFPALYGTFLMTTLLSLAVAPFGVVAALYLREYARQGWLVSTVRICVNNLAGVPSIVFGVFGLGFFCYGVGGAIDRAFFPERLPSPTFGTGGILWASLTLALLTVPVVIVSTEEALAAVPRSAREGSYACGASRWQTIWRIVLPAATPGILTGLILAMARGAGEVAPLMLTGVVKLAPELPLDGHFPYLHLERSFMHLGFHIFDVGFQSRNSEAAKPMVYTTTLLLLALVAVMNLSAIWIRNRLRRRYRTGAF